MLPVSLTTLVIRIIFKLKLADIIIIVTAGGPGGATDSVTSFIVREYRDRSNVGYGTLLSFVYLILIIIFMTILIRFVNRWLQRECVMKNSISEKIVIYGILLFWTFICLVSNILDRHNFI